jgi:invasion protein IalB
MQQPMGRILYIFVLGFVVTTIGASLIAEAHADRRVALVVGNSAYRNVSELRNPVNDAMKIGAMLKMMGFEVDVRRDVGITEMRRAVGDFADAARNADIAVVFYSGHGIEVDGSNYLIPIDARLERDFDVEDETISLDRVLKVIDVAKSLRLVMLDACRNNPFVRTMKRSAASRSIGRGLARVDPILADTYVAFAARAGSVADDGDGPNSPFTTAVLKHLIVPGLDIRQAFGYVRDEVMSATRNRQEPWTYGSLGGNAVVLVPGPATPLPPAARPLPGLDTENALAQFDFDQAQRTNTPDALRAFLRMYPSGPLADRARDKLALLGGEPAKPRTQTSATQSSTAITPSPDQLVQLVYSPWTKVCLKGREVSQGPALRVGHAQAKPVCFTGKDGRVESGMPVVAALLIEPENEPTKKVLRVTLPLGMSLQPGTRVIIDNGQPMAGPYVICLITGCMADYEASGDLVGKLKNAQRLVIQGINGAGKPVSLHIPLADFGKAYDGPPTDSRVYEAQQKQLQDQLQRRAEETRTRAR